MSETLLTKKERAALSMFQRHMKKKLIFNAKKGGWQKGQCGTGWLLKELRRNVRQTVKTLDAGACMDAEEISKHVMSDMADVANLAMMIADLSSVSNLRNRL